MSFNAIRENFRIDSSQTLGLTARAQSMEVDY